MKKLLLSLSCMTLICSTSALAQDFLGFRQSNYSGVSGGDFNPASIADNRFIVDVTLGGFSNSTYNDHLYFNTRLMPYWWSQSFDDSDSKPRSPA